MPIVLCIKGQPSVVPTGVIHTCIASLVCKYCAQCYLTLLHQLLPWQQLLGWEVSEEHKSEHETGTSEVHGCSCGSEALSAEPWIFISHFSHKEEKYCNRKQLPACLPACAGQPQTSLKAWSCPTISPSAGAGPFSNTHTHTSIS